MATQVIDRIDKHIHKYTIPLIALTALVLILNALVFGWLFWRQTTWVTVEIKNFRAPAETSLCPGDILHYSFAIDVSGAALVDVSTSVQPLISIRPSYVRLQQFDFSGPVSFELVRHWVVPPTYTDPASGAEVPWQPGKYVQRTLAYVNGRSENEAELEVPFIIKADCP